MSPTSPKHSRKTVRRSAVAATAVAAAATLTVATPATANAAPTGNPQIDAILAAAPLLPGGIPIAVIPQAAPIVNQGVAAWNQIPVISGLIPVSNTTAPILGATPLAPGWLGLGVSDTFAVGAPLGLGGLSSTTYGLVGVAPGGGTGSIGGNVTTINGPLGSALGLNTSLSAITAGGLTTWTPSLGLNATAPLGLGSATATIVPVKVTYGANTFVVGLPAINLGLTTPLGGGNLVLNLGSIGFQNGQLVLVTPSISGAITTPLGGGNVGVTPGTITVGTGGLTVDAPDLTAGVNVGNVVTAGLNVDGGSGSVTPTGVSVTGPSGTGTVSTPVGGGTVTASTGSASAGSNGVSVTGPAASGSVTTPVASGEAAVSTGSATVATNGNTTVTGPTAEAEVTTPAGSASGHVETGSASVSPSTGSASVTGPSGGVETSTAAGDHGVEADTGSATASSSGVSVTDTPSVDAH